MKLSKIKDKPVIYIQSFEEADALKIIEDIDEVVDSFGPNQPILVHIDSYGGYMDGLAMIYEKLQSIPNQIITYCSSKAMSAGATLLITAATPGNRIMSPNASLMIHELSAGNGGPMRDMDNYNSYLKAKNDKWYDMIAKAAGMKDGEALKDMVSERARRATDMFLTAEEAQQLGFIDEIGYLHMVPELRYHVALNKQSRREKEELEDRLHEKAQKQAEAAAKRKATIEKQKKGKK